MADVFISYKREDRPRLRPLVDAFAAEGLTVWWDVAIEGGAAWRRSIQTELQAARCVLVAWSERSIGRDGEFVQDEASWAKVRGLYLPVALDDVIPPLGFGQVQMFPLWGWKDRRDGAFAAVLKAVRAMLAQDHAPLTIRSPESGAPAEADRSQNPVVAVLPFGAPPGDSALAYFAQGLAEEVIVGLSRSSLVRVLPSQTSLTFTGRGLATGRLCAELGADYIVQGQVRLNGAQTRVSAQLTHGAADKVVWTVREDRPTPEMLALQDEIVGAIVAGLEPALLAHEEEQAFRTPVEHLGRWDLFLRGRWYFWRGRRHDAQLARGCLEKALTMGPADAPTLSLLAYCWMHDVWMGAEKDPRRAIGEAHRLARDAVSLDGDDAFAHFTLGVVLSMTGRVGEAVAEQHRAIELNPCLAAASGELARLAAFAGRVDEAIDLAETAIGASPNDPHVWLWYRAKAHALFVAARYQEAMVQAARACARRPDYYFLHELLAACAMAGGDEDQARAALSEARQTMPHHSLAALRATHPFADSAVFERYLAALRAAGWDECAAPEVMQASV